MVCLKTKFACTRMHEINSKLLSLQKRQRWGWYSCRHTLSSSGLSPLEMLSIVRGSTPCAVDHVSFTHYCRTSTLWQIKPKTIKHVPSGAFVPPETAACQDQKSEMSAIISIQYDEKQNNNSKCSGYVMALFGYQQCNSPMSSHAVTSRCCIKDTISTLPETWSRCWI